MAAAGTTTFAGYGAIWADSLDACFRAAEAHGIRAILGKVMMDRASYDDRLRPEQRLETSLRQSAELCERWHGAADGRLRYAFTPRFAVSCSADLLRESAALADHYGATWQTHLSEDRREIATVAELFPEALDYLDVYDRAGALGPRALLAHAIHLSDREVARVVETDSAIAHCPVSNMFISSGVMPLARYRAEGIRVGLGTDVAGAPELSVVTQMRDGFYQQNSRHTLDARRPSAAGPARLAAPGHARWRRGPRARRRHRLARGRQGGRPHRRRRRGRPAARGRAPAATSRRSSAASSSASARAWCAAPGCAGIGCPWRSSSD